VIRPYWFFPIISTKNLVFYLYVFSSVLYGQFNEKYIEYKSLTKRVYNFTKVEFITEEGEFNDAICTLLLPDLNENSPPLVAIYYKKTNSNWFTESLYRKRVRFTFQNGVLKLDRSNFWAWDELEEIKVVIIY
tara:strand:- start:1548 stop:1946 length:399 start_codon:yes stop_codon:yes gene_type:complete